MKYTFAIWACFPLVVMLITQSSCAQNVSEEKIRRRKKIALVIGVSTYHWDDSSKVAIKDALDMSGALSSIDFQVCLLSNPDLPTLNMVFDSLYKAANGAAAFVFYFSGDGFEVMNRDYLLFRGTNFNSASDLKKQTCSLQDILDKMGKVKANVNILLLDMCRFAPPKNILTAFTRSEETSVDNSSTYNPCFIGCATSSGNPALARKEGNSIFTASLLKYMEDPALSLDRIFNLVNHDVRIATRGQQIPVSYNTLESEFYLTDETSEPTH